MYYVSRKEVVIDVIFNDYSMLSAGNFNEFMKIFQYAWYVIKYKLMESYVLLDNEAVRNVRM